MVAPQLIWLAADYHFPSTYSCRLPMSSMVSALVSPAPGPATVRLALIRTGIELFGIEHVREVLFPHIRSMNVFVRPPEKVALSIQVLRAYKADESRTSIQVNEAPMNREMAHAEGLMTVYIEIPVADVEQWKALLLAIGYWGQTNSFASCIDIGHVTPNSDECALPLRRLSRHAILRPFFSCVLSEFRNSNVAWDDVVSLEGSPGKNPLKLDVYVWPLLLARHQHSGKLLVRSSFASQANVGRMEDAR